VVHEYYPEDTRVRWQARLLGELGLAVTVVCLRGRGQERRGWHENVAVRRLPVARHRGAGCLVYFLEYVSFAIAALVCTTRLALVSRPELVIVSTIPDFLALAALPAKLTGARVILDMHELFPELLAARYGLHRGHHVLKIARLVERLATHLADHVITANETIAAVVCERCDLPARRVSAAVTSIQVDGLAKRREDVQREHPTTLIYHGKLIDEYDVEGVIRALGVLVDEGLREFRLEVYGKGPRLDSCLAAAERLMDREYVTFHEYVSHEEVLDAVMRADAGVVPLSDSPYTEVCLPRKLLELAALEVPIIAPRKANLCKYFPGEAVCYYDGTTEGSLVEALRCILTDHELRQELAKRGAEAYRRISATQMDSSFRESVARTLCAHQ